MRVGWIDPDVDLAEWVDAPDEPLLSQLLGVAYEKCVAWAPKPVPTGTLLDVDGVTVLDPIPAGYGYAQRLLTMHLWARKRAGDGEGFGSDGYMLQTYPLVREAYDAIRPKRQPMAGLL